MSGKKIAYIRVSTYDQNPSRQLDGIEFDRVFTDYVSGKDRNRPQLQELIKFVREDDKVYIHSMDRLARNLEDLRKLVRIITIEKEASLYFHKEQLTFTNQDNPMSTFLLSVMGAFAEFERSLIKERQMEGIAIAKREKKFKGRKMVLTHDQLLEIKEKLKLGTKKIDIVKEYGISRQALYNYLSGKISFDNKQTGN